VSRTSGLSREHRGPYRKTKIGTEVAYVTRDSDTTYKIKRSKVMIIAGVGASGGGIGGRGKQLLRCRLLGCARRFGAHGEQRGGGISWRPPAYSLL